MRKDQHTESDMQENTDSALANPFARLRFVLVNTSHPGNIGAAARALRTMGLHRLALVAPQRFPHAEAIAMAAGADDVLDETVICADIPTAIAECRLVLGASARRRGVAMEQLSPRDASGRVLEALARGHEVAVLFGNERTGLDNDEIKHCHASIVIPADPTHSSLNLAQAVQVIAYELRVAWLMHTATDASIPHSQPASAAEMEGFFMHLARTLDDIDFHKGRSPRTILQRLRRFFLRAQPDARELRVLRGILADASRMARLARERTSDQTHALSPSVGRHRDRTR